LGCGIGDNGSILDQLGTGGSHGAGKLLEHVFIEFLRSSVEVVE